jgi:hypothetical protein
MTNLFNPVPGVDTGLDVDGVLADFATHFINKAKEMGLGSRFPACAGDVRSWMFCDPIDFKTVWKAIESDMDWWMSIPPIESSVKFFWDHPEFVPRLYCTHRPVDSLVTLQWLNLNGFPVSPPTFTAKERNDKLAILKENGVTTFVDDNVEQIRHLNAGGIRGILFKAPYQVAEDVSGLTIIDSLYGLIEPDNQLEAVVAGCSIDRPIYLGA